MSIVEVEFCSVKTLIKIFRIVYLELKIERDADTNTHQRGLSFVVPFQQTKKINTRVKYTHAKTSGILG